MQSNLNRRKLDTSDTPKLPMKFVINSSSLNQSSSHHHHHHHHQQSNSLKFNSKLSSSIHIWSLSLILSLSLPLLLSLLSLIHFTSSQVSANSIVGVHVEHFPNINTNNQNNYRLIDDPKNSNNEKLNEITSFGTSSVDIKPDLFGLITEVNVECNSNTIKLSLIAPHLFNGMIYPKGLSKNSSCMHEYYDVKEFNYTLPLRACNTMSMDVDDGIEYFNTIIVQPHRRLVTNQGRGYHIRCHYQTKDKRITNGYNLTLSPDINGSNDTQSLYGQAPVPTSSMKIYHQGSQKELIADNVKIGDRLTLQISIEKQNIYGMKITNCLVRDGLNWGEQPLINDEGCPVDKEIMGQFDYTNNLTLATVSFHAHKFPYTSSVYYQCNVRLCLKDESDGCFDTPPRCDENGRNYRHLPNNNRRRRDTYDAIVIPDVNNQQYLAMAQRMMHQTNKMDKDLSMEVYSGLYVDENENNTPELDDEISDNDLSSSTANNRNNRKKFNDPNEFCISMRKFAIGVAIASLLLMLAVLLLIICILQRRKRRHHYNQSATSPSGHQRLYSSPAGSTIESAGSVYSGPYTNRGYIRD